MANKWQLLSHAIMGNTDKSATLAHPPPPAPLANIDRVPQQRLVTDASSAAQAGLRDMLVAAGHRVVADPAAAVPVRRARRNSGFAAAAQSAAWAASAVAAAEAADASFIEAEEALARKRAEEAAAAVALLPAVSRRVAVRVAQFMPGAAPGPPSSPRSSSSGGSVQAQPGYRFLRRHEVPPENGAAYLRAVLKGHAKVLARLRNGGPPRSVVLQAEHEAQLERQRQRSPRATSPRDSTATLRAVADFLASVDVAAPLEGSAAAATSFTSLPASPSALFDSRASLGSVTRVPAESVQTLSAAPRHSESPPQHGVVSPEASKCSVGDPIGSLLASRAEWERRVRSGANPALLEPAPAASVHSFTLHIPRAAAVHADAASAQDTIIVSSTAEAYLSLRDLQQPFPHDCTVLDWAKAVFGPLEKGGLGVQLKAMLDIPPWLAEEERSKGMQAALDEARSSLEQQPHAIPRSPRSPRNDEVSSGSTRAAAPAGGVYSLKAQHAAVQDESFPELCVSGSDRALSPVRSSTSDGAAPHPAEQLRLHAYFKTPDLPPYLPLNSRHVAADSTQWPTVATMRAYVEDSALRSAKGLAERSFETYYQQMLKTKGAVGRRASEIAADVRMHGTGYAAVHARFLKFAAEPVTEHDTMQRGRRSTLAGGEAKEDAQSPRPLRRRSSVAQAQQSPQDASSNKTPRPPPSARPQHSHPSPASRLLRRSRPAASSPRSTVSGGPVASDSHACSAATSGVLATVRDLGTLSPRLAGLSVMDVLPEPASQARQKHKRALSPRPGAEDEPPIVLHAADLHVLSRVALDQKLAHHISVIDRERSETLRLKHDVLGKLLDVQTGTADVGAIGGNMGFLRFHAERERRAAHTESSSRNIEWFSVLLAELTSRQVQLWVALLGATFEPLPSLFPPPSLCPLVLQPEGSVHPAQRFLIDALRREVSGGRELSRDLLKSFLMTLSMKDSLWVPPTTTAVGTSSTLASAVETHPLGAAITALASAQQFVERRTAKASPPQLTRKRSVAEIVVQATLTLGRRPSVANMATVAMLGRRPSVHALAALVEKEVGGDKTPADPQPDDFSAALKVPGRPNHAYTATQLLQMHTEADPPMILSHPAIQTMLAFLRRVAGISLFEWDAIHSQLGLLPHAAPLEVILQKAWLDRQKEAAGGHTATAAAHISESQDVLQRIRHAGGVLSEYAAANLLLSKQKLAQAENASAVSLAAAAAVGPPPPAYIAIPARRDAARAAQDALIAEQERFSLKVRQRRALQRDKSVQAATAVAAVESAAASAATTATATDILAVLQPALPQKFAADQLPAALPTSEATEASALASPSEQQRRMSLTSESAARLPARQFSLAFERVDHELSDEVLAEVASSRSWRAAAAQEPEADTHALEGTLAQLSQALPPAPRVDRSGSIAEWDE